MSHPPTQPDDAADGPRADTPSPADAPRPGDKDGRSRPASPPPGGQDEPANPPPGGQHAAPRPTPPTEPPASSRDIPHEGVPRETVPTATPGTRQGGAPAATGPAQPQAGAAAAPTPPPGEGPALPEVPRRPGFGRRLIGALLGFVLTPVALTMTGIGTARLADIAGTSDMGTDLLGGTLLTIGVVMLAVIVLLGIWTTSVPIVGGLVWGVALGLAYLIVPGAMQDGAEAMTADRNVPEAIDQVADAGMSGYLVVLGFILVAAGLATTLARRSGRRFAERTAQVERARAEIERRHAEEERRRAATASPQHR